MEIWKYQNTSKGKYKESNSKGCLPAKWKVKRKRFAKDIWNGNHQFNVFKLVKRMVKTN